LEYNKEDMEKILKRLKESSESICITETKHFIKRTEEYKYCDHEIIYHELNNSCPCDIKPNGKNKFKTLYNHLIQKFILFV
jgi:hypothetical protein